MTTRHNHLLCLLGLSLAMHLPAATFTVNSLTDSGPGSLRQAILDANAAPGGDEIDFAVNGTIAISNNLPIITDMVTITGPGTNLLTISGSKQYQLLRLYGGNTNSIIDLRLADAKMDGWYSISHVTNACGIVNSGNLTLVRCVIQDCLAELCSGGGHWQYRATHHGGYCGGYWAGGIHASTLTMTNSTVRDCSARGGAGLSIGAGTLVGYTISGNSANDAYGGAGVWSYGDLAMYNCTLSGNRVSAGTLTDPMMAAALRIESGSVYANHCTIISNTSSVGIEIKAEGIFAAANSIIGNVTGPLNSLGQNLIVNTNGTTITNSESGNIYNVNPNLGPLQNNGGSTFTHALLAGSAAIDHGASDGLSTDQRGAQRFLAADIGAYEVTATAVPPNFQIILSDPTHAMVSWPAAAGPVVLQQNLNGNGGTWSDVGTLPFNDGSTMRVVLPVSETKNFYRLRSP